MSFGIFTIELLRLLDDMEEYFAIAIARTEAGEFAVLDREVLEQFNARLKEQILFHGTTKNLVN